MTEGKNILEKLGRIKYPLLMLCIGLMLLLIPGKGSQEIASPDADQLLQQLLACTDGIGQVRVLSSENGAVIVCQGAENATVRLDIIRAVNAYTGFPSDRITILKMASESN